MPENVTPLPSKGLGNIQWRDFFKGLYYACFGSLVAFVGFFFDGIIQETPVFPTWAEIVPFLRNFASAVGGYLLAKLTMNNVGQILTKNKDVVPIATDTLKKIKEELKAENKVI